MNELYIKLKNHFSKIIFALLNFVLSVLNVSNKSFNIANILSILSSRTYFDIAWVWYTNKQNLTYAFTPSTFGKRNIFSTKVFNDSTI